MRGLSPVLSTTLLVLMVVFAGVSVSLSISRTRDQLETQASEALIIPKLEPKIVDYHCFENYAYFLVFMNQGEVIRGVVPYKIKERSAVIRSGGLALNLTSKGNIYFEGPFEVGHDYSITLTTNNWVITRQCRAVRHPDMVLHLTFRENAGSRARDSTSYRNDGVLYDSPTWVTGVSDYALLMNGSQYVMVSDDADTLRPATFTLSVWLYRFNHEGDREVVISKQAEDAGFELASMSDGTVQLNVTGSGTSTSVSTPVTNEQWTQLIATFNSTHLNLYDGCTLMNTTEANFTASASALYVGKGEAYLNGSVDEVRIYRQALSADELAVFCQAGTVQAGAYGT